MSRIGKFTVSAALLLPLALGGCKPSRSTASPEDYFPLIQVALTGGETASMIGRNEAIKDGHFEGCVASEALISAFGGANEVLGGRLMDKVTFPSLDVDVSECLALRDESKNPDGNPDAAVLVEAISGITLAAVAHYAAKIKDSDCKKGSAALGAVTYVQGMVSPVAEEIADPDGKMSVPSVVVDLSECEVEE